MTWLNGLLISHAKKNKIKRHTGGINKNRATRYKDPEKYMGGKGSKQRRKIVKYDGGVKTRNEFIDRRANTSGEPVYMKITHYRRSNPMDNNWVEVGTPTRRVISYSTFLKERSDDLRIQIEKKGNFVRYDRDEEYPESHFYLRILDGDRMKEECREYALKGYPLLSDF